jgi:hypothetical protein
MESQSTTPREPVEVAEEYGEKSRRRKGRAEVHWDIRKRDCSDIAREDFIERPQVVTFALRGELCN